MFLNKKQKPSGTIIIIDDDPTSLQMLAQMITKAGHIAILADCGEKGLALARENNPDVIIIDVVMPGMDGFMLLKELKKDTRLQHIPVLVLSARQNVADTVRRLGAVHFLSKPVAPDQLISHIEKLLQA